MKIVKKYSKNKGSVEHLIEYLKNNNIKTIGNIVDGNEINESDINDNYEKIKNFEKI